MFLNNKKTKREKRNSPLLINHQEVYFLFKELLQSKLIKVIYANFFLTPLFRPYKKVFVRIFVFRLNFGFRPDFRLSARVSNQGFRTFGFSHNSDIFDNMYSVNRSI
jgi:hypothetical protein